ncbi:hypothetical protein CFO_g5014 [Ceratocystis platani]|uniref:Uncharacterized protein n=1 Tax=Ceratocystis fimbriata f. sp. platani TaxID=88771 RepID=A0A0F8B022_CERFI|nr:hypothetical protein CFO_g5014 [Ceratocystis platani]
MPRRLPPGWDRNETSDLKEKTGLPPLSDQEPIKRQHIAGDGSSKNEEQGDKQPLSLTPKISKKIDEVYMISGIGNDDMYCMVEDELYEVAKKFTAHLHEAEYQRLKSEAQSLDAGAGRKIVRPVVRSAMDSTEQRIECASRLEILRKATKKSHGNTEADADDDGMLDATLAEYWRTQKGKPAKISGSSKGWATVQTTVIKFGEPEKQQHAVIRPCFMALYAVCILAPRAVKSPIPEII